MAFKEALANSLTQGGVKTDINWGDILALAIPALSMDPDASKAALSGWQIGKTIRDNQALREEAQQQEQQGKGFIADYLNAENVKTQKMKELAAKLPGLTAMPETLPSPESSPFAVDEYINTPAVLPEQFGGPGQTPTEMPAAPIGQSSGQIINAGDIPNAEKIQALANWANEAKDAQSPFDMAAMFAKYPKAPLNIATTLLAEQFQLRRQEAKALLDQALKERENVLGIYRDKKKAEATGEEARKTEAIKGYNLAEGAQRIVNGQVVAENPKSAKEPNIPMYENFPVGNGTREQKYKYNEKTGEHDIPVGTSRPIYKEGTAGEKPEMKPAAAMKRLSAIEMGIARLKGGSPLDAALVMALGPQYSVVLGNDDPAVKQAALSQLNQEKEYVSQFVPENFRPKPAPVSKTINKTMGNLWSEAIGQGSSSAAVDYLKNTYSYSDAQAKDIVRQGIKAGKIR